MPAAIRACKNEHGDALSQAIVYYAHFLAQALENVLHYYNYDTRFPSILMVDMGMFFLIHIHRVFMYLQPRIWDSTVPYGTGIV